jgi:hypothetical protein
VEKENEPLDEDALQVKILELLGSGHHRTGAQIIKALDGDERVAGILGTLACNGDVASEWCAQALVGDRWYWRPLIGAQRVSGGGR